MKNVIGRFRKHQMGARFFWLVLLCMGLSFVKGQAYFAEKKISGELNSLSDVFRKPIQGNLFLIPFGSNNKKFEVNRYNGTIMQKFPPHPKLDTLSIQDMCEWNGEYYFAGYFSNWGGSNRNFGLIKFNGSKWDTISGMANVRVSSVSISSNKLYAAVFNAETLNSRIVRLDASGKVDPLVTRKSLQFSNYASIALGSQRVLFIPILGKDSVFYSFDTSGLRDSVIFDRGIMTPTFAILHDSLVLFCKDLKELHAIKENLQIEHIVTLEFPIYNFCTSGDYLYYQYSNDTIPAIKRHNIKTGIRDTVIGLTGHICGNDKALYSIDRVNTSTWNEIAYMLDGNVAVVRGKIYEDVNVNCVWDSPDAVYPGFRYTARKGTDTFVFYAQDSGNYQALLPVGTYSFFPGEKYAQSREFVCGTPTKSFAVLKTYENVNVPFSWLTSQRDLLVSIHQYSGFRARQGFTEFYDVVCKNEGTQDENATVTFTYPDSVTYIWASDTPYSHVGRTLTFKINNLGKKSKHKIQLAFTIDKNNRLGSTLVYTAGIDPILGDKDSLSNADTLKLKVVSAHDPNNKECSPDGVVYDEVPMIKYHIHFQNTGVDTAYGVVVTDSFSPDFPLYKLQMTGSSHNYSLHVESGNLLVWEFDNIKLPPRMEGSPNSEGYITFEAPLYAPLKKGQTIKNRAYIYFDYQEPIITPEAWLTRSQWGLSVYTPQNNLPFTVFPNPTQGKIKVVAYNNVQLQLYNLQGALLQSQTCTGADIELNLENYPSGVYILRALGYNGAYRVMKQ